MQRPCDPPPHKRQKDRWRQLKVLAVKQGDSSTVSEDDQENAAPRYLRTTITTTTTTSTGPDNDDGLDVGAKKDDTAETSNKAESSNKAATAHKAETAHNAESLDPADADVRGIPRGAEESMRSCVFLSDWDDMLAAEAQQERTSSRARLADTPSWQRIFELLTGDVERRVRPEPFCETCGITGHIFQEMCRGCMDMHCGTCLWRRPDAGPKEKGICAHCVFSIGEGNGLWVVDISPDDKDVLDEVKKDNDFMDYAWRLGRVWDRAEGEHEDYMQALHHRD